MNRALHILTLLFLCCLWTAPSQAEQQDVAATARGVVRVALIATNGDDAYFVGHGSGFAVAPNKVLTNAHVVELLRTEKNLVVGIIPSEGKRSYGGKLIAYSPGNDLALIELKEGTLPVATFFSGALTDGQHVTAIGYPAAVDRAQGLNLKEIIQPLSPVKTSGTVSTGRASHGFDTVLHTAPMAQGNSGGPLVDDCGRVIGVNSFGSQAESDADAEFGFAVSNREIASFLRQADVAFRRTATPCRSIAELDAAEAKRKQEEFFVQQRREQMEADAREKARSEARSRAEQEVYAARENMIALAGVLLLFGGLSLGAAMMFHVEGREKERLRAGAAGVLLLVAAIVAFLLRPSFDGIDDRIGQAGDQDGKPSTETVSDVAGDKICRIEESRSRMTVSDVKDVPLQWTETGCVNGSTQYSQNGSEWSRIFVPESEAVVSINSYAPDTGAYKVERFLADADTLDKARELRSHFKFEGCTADPEKLGELQQMQSELLAILPNAPNERLIYQCTKAAPEEPQ